MLYAEDNGGIISTNNTIITSEINYLEEASLSFRRHDYRSAIEFYEHVLETSPIIEIDYFVNLAKSYIALGDYKQAIVATRRGIRFNSVISWEIYYQQGYAFYKLGEYPNAILAVERALVVNESAYLYNYLGLMHLYSEDYPKAQENFLLSTTYSPNNATYLCNLAASYEMQRNYNDALSTYERAVSFDTEGRTHAKREVTRIRNYLTTRNLLPQESQDSNTANSINTVYDDVGIEHEEVDNAAITDTDTSITNETAQ